MNNEQIYKTMQEKRLYLTSVLGTILDSSVTNIDYDEILHNLNNEKFFSNVRLLKGDEKIFGSIEINNKTYEIKISFIKVNNTQEYNENIDILAYMSNLTEKEVEQWKKSKFTVLVEMNFNEIPDESYFAQLKILDCINPNYILLFDENSQKVFSAKWVKMLLEDNIFPLNTSLFTIHSSYDEKLNHYWFHTHGLNRCGCIELEMLQLTAELGANYEILNRIGAIFIEEGTYPKDKEILAGYSNNIYLTYTWKPWEEAIKLYRNKKNTSKFLQNFIDKKDTFLGDLKDRDESHSMPSGVLFTLNNDKIDKPSAYTLLLKNNLVYFYTDRETKKLLEMSKVRIKYLKEIFEKDGNIHDYQIKVGLDAKDENGDFKEYLWITLKEINGEEIKATLKNEPYYIKNMKQGETYTINKDDIADWRIYTKEEIYNPDNIYKYYI